MLRLVQVLMGLGIPEADVFRRHYKVFSLQNLPRKEKEVNMMHIK